VAGKLEWPNFGELARIEALWNSQEKIGILHIALLKTFDRHINLERR
jgi:hypothetical protein